MASKLFGCKNIMCSTKEKKKEPTQKITLILGCRKMEKNLTSKVATNAKLQTSKFCLIFVVFVNPDL
jgi:hypothetical protein